MSDPSALLNDLSEEALQRLEEICCRFEESWQAGQRPYLEEYLAGPEDIEQLAVLRELLRLDVFYRCQAGEMPSARDYATRFPHATVLLDELFARLSEGCPAAPVLCAEDTTPDAERTGPHSDASNTEERGADNAEEQSDRNQPSFPPSSPTSRFRMLRFHAAGGLGEVFVAEDVELHREVALKEIKRAYTSHEDRRRRFVLEAEITGNLEHPGIVPVYGLGKYPDGRPYYAMRFIRGNTLEEAIQHFHLNPSVQFDALEFRQLLGRLVAVCQAIAYAHNRGVLHRDIKPGNIMLGKFGETLVVDWGLAKVVSRPDAGKAGPGEEGLLQPMGGGAEATVGVVGTPAFMSPEQAAGKVEELGPATDVYSLGATLYALLTNRAPFQGKVVEVVRQVERGEWLAPRQVNGSVPAALDAICRKAMALAPAERYPSALELAADVERWLADEPVRAYREPLRRRLLRWMRKHQRTVTGVTVLLLTALVGLAVGSVLLERRNREARENFDMAQKEATQFLAVVGEDVVLDEPGLRPFRQRLLIDLLVYYQDFLAKRPGDPVALQQLAEAKRQLSELYAQLHRIPEAEPLIQNAQKLYEQLLEKSPSDRDLRFGQARLRQTAAELLAQTGHPQLARQELDRGIQDLEQLRKEEMRNTRFRTLLARGYDLRATVTAGADLNGALADNQRAIDLLLQATAVDSRGDERQTFHLLQHEPAPGFSSAVSQSALRFILPFQARVAGNRGALLKMAGRTSEAAQQLGKAILVQRLCARAAPSATWPRLGLARLLLLAGQTEIELGRPTRAEVSLLEARGIFQRLQEASPGVPEYQPLQVGIAASLGEDQLSRGRTTAAASLLREAVEGDEHKEVRQRIDPTLCATPARAHYLLGLLQAEVGNLDEGLQTCTMAREAQLQALAVAPGDKSLRSDLLTTEETLLRLRFERREIDRDSWIGSQRHIFNERQKLARDAAESLFQAKLACSTIVLAVLLRESGKLAEALQLLDHALSVHEQQPVQDKSAPLPNHPASPALLPGQAREDVWRLGPEALESLEQTPLALPSSELRRQKAALLACRASVLARLGRDREGADLIEQALHLTNGLLDGNLLPRCPPASSASVWSFLAQELYCVEPCYLYDRACYLALASTLADRDQRDALAAQAVQAIQLYVSYGFDNFYKLRTDEALSPLRGRADFQSLLRDLQNRLRPG